MSKKEPQIFVNHIGFVCQSEKRVIVTNSRAKRFEVQDMSRVKKETLGEYEDWETVYTGKLIKRKSPMGTYRVGDFSELDTPGIYRIVLPDHKTRSYQFKISDGIYHPLVRMFLDFVHNWRSGDFQNEWRGPGHLDDAIRSDNGAYHDASGGWYDAGDTRKWMTMSTLPVPAFLDIYEGLEIKGSHFAKENVASNDLITEAIWGIRFILKMQDPDTGMIFEEVGAGGDARKKPGMTWWYENHSGCLADNSQNHFTDNQINSGDERTIRTTYNPIVQYTNLYILLRSAVAIREVDSHLADQCLESARRIWEFIHPKQAHDPLHQWTSVRSWRLMAGIELLKHQIITEVVLEEMFKELMDNYDENLGFWHMDSEKIDPYRGILHSAQPLIALGKLIESFRGHDRNKQVINLLKYSWEIYIRPMISTNPFGIMPYGIFMKKTKKDKYRNFIKGLFFRFYMPDHSPQKINHGLGGHWTSWAHALALCGKILKQEKMTQASWDQLYWLLGGNELNVSQVSGVGYNNPMPHSRFLGTYPGGFCVGPRGNASDRIVIDRKARAEWNSTEYWLTPLSNTLMALAILLPREIKTENKIGHV
jgi:hypothetical protein